MGNVSNDRQARPITTRDLGLDPKVVKRYAEAQEKKRLVTQSHIKEGLVPAAICLGLTAAAGGIGALTGGAKGASRLNGASIGIGIGAALTVGTWLCASIADRVSDHGAYDGVYQEGREDRRLRETAEVEQPLRDLEILVAYNDELRTLGADGINRAAATVIARSDHNGDHRVDLRGGQALAHDERLFDDSLSGPASRNGEARSDFEELLAADRAGNRNGFANRDEIAHRILKHIKDGKLGQWTPKDVIRATELADQQSSAGWDPPWAGVEDSTADVLKTVESIRRGDYHW